MWNDLASRIDHVSKTRGDGAGFDILAFDIEGNELYVEVKTTTGGKGTQFYVTGNELALSQQKGEQFVLYRIFDWNGTEGKFWRVAGPLDEQLELQPVVFSASR